MDNRVTHEPLKKVIVVEADFNNLMVIAEERRKALLKVLDTAEKLMKVINPHLALIDKGGIALGMKIPTIISDIKANAEIFTEVFSEEFLKQLKELTNHEVSRQ